MSKLKILPSINLIMERSKDKLDIHEDYLKFLINDELEYFRKKIINEGLEIGKDDDWLEVLGCGMVNVKVLENCGIDTEKYRETISKNSQGDPLKFELNLSVNYIISENQKTLVKREITKKYI